MLRRLIILLAAAASPVAAQRQRVYVRTPAPGEPGAILAQALRGPYIVRHEQWNTRLFRDSVFRSTVIVAGSDASVASTVHGDVIVVGGDLFLRPGAHIDGRAIAYGGAVYDSQQAVVAGERLSFRDVHFTVTQTSEGIALDYRAEPGLPVTPLVTFSMLYGVRLPTYTRVDGASIAWGPRVQVGDDELVVDPTLVYRSDLGAFDPVVTATAHLGTAWEVDAMAGTGTFTNDGWIESDLTNSITVLLAGRDYRNYWRGDRFEGRAARNWVDGERRLTVWAGARTERDRSVTAGGPWSVTGQTNRVGMIRVNPPVERGRLTSALAGANGATVFGDITLTGALTVESVVDAPRDAHFTQSTLDAQAEFPTFGTQSLSLRSHLVLTAGDSAPPERFAYLGGAATLTTLDILEFGGDELAYLEGLYNVPLAFVQVPLVGSPVLSLRYAAGSAGVSHLPRLEENVGLRLSVSIAFVEWAIDPATRHDAFGVGFRAPVLH